MFSSLRVESQAVSVSINSRGLIFLPVDQGIPNCAEAAGLKCHPGASSRQTGAEAPADRRRDGQSDRGSGEGEENEENGDEHDKCKARAAWQHTNEAGTIAKLPNSSCAKCLVI